MCNQLLWLVSAHVCAWIAHGCALRCVGARIAAGARWAMAGGEGVGGRAGGFVSMGLMGSRFLNKGVS